MIRRKKGGDKGSRGGKGRRMSGTVLHTRPRWARNNEEKTKKIHSTTSYYPPLSLFSLPARAGGGLIHLAIILMAFCVEEQGVEGMRLGLEKVTEKGGGGVGSWLYVRGILVTFYQLVRGGDGGGRVIGAVGLDTDGVVTTVF